MAEQYDIEGKAKVKIAELQAKARKILAQSELAFEKEKIALEMMREKRLKDVEIRRAKELGDLEGGKLKQYVECLGRDTLVQLSRAGPDAQAEILGSLGLQGYMIMDSVNPVNLFSSASGIMGNLLPQLNNSA